MTQVHDHQDLALPFPDAEEHPDGGGRPYRRLLTVREVAERLNIGRTKVFHLMAAGQLQSVHIGRLRRVPVEAVEAYVQSLVRDSRGIPLRT